MPMTVAIAADTRGLVRSWQRWLEASDRSEPTRLAYSRAVDRFLAWLAGQGMPTTVTAISREHCEEWLIVQRRTKKPATLRLAHIAVGVFFRWLVEEGERPDNPLTRVPRPAVDYAPPAVLTLADLRRVLAACGGATFDDRRDLAIIRLFIDTGLRVTELATIRLGDLDLDLATVTVLGKGRKTRTVPFGKRTGLALDRYLRLRARHAYATATEVWLGRKGPLTDNGVHLIVKRRGAQAGIPAIWPHLFRHTLAHRWLADGGQEGDLMRIAGWSSREMVSHYGASAAVERAHEAHRRIGLGDRV